MSLLRENNKPATPADMISALDGGWSVLAVINGEYQDIDAEAFRKVTRIDVNKGILRQHLADRLFNFIPPWDREYESADDIAKDIQEDPELVIEYLMDLLEGM